MEALAEAVPAVEVTMEALAEAGRALEAVRAVGRVVAKTPVVPVRGAIPAPAAANGAETWVLAASSAATTAMMVCDYGALR